MCRLFLWRDSETNVETNAIMEFLQQSDHLHKHTPGINNEHDYQFHMDGFGLAGFRAGRWYTYKTPLLYRNVRDLSGVVERFARYRFVIGHIRKATANTKTAIEYTHPFYYRNHMFMHNGELHGFTDKKRSVVRTEIDADLRSEIRGQTDTEHIFYLFLSKLRLYTKRAKSESESEILKDAIVSTLEFLKSNFPTFTANFMYSNKHYTCITRYSYQNPTPEPFPTKIRAPSLYWNIDIPKPKISGVFPKYFPTIAISSEPILPTQKLVPSRTLILLENSTGVVSIQSLRL